MHLFLHLDQFGASGFFLEARQQQKKLGKSSRFELSPNHQWWCAKWKLGWNTYALHTYFCTFGADLCAQSVLINKISASELRRKLIKSALLVGLMQKTVKVLL